MDIDSEVFDVQTYTTQLLQRESLKGLVQTDTELLRKIRSLDGELQDLVYKNYSKFISATDTIRQMKENVSDMDSKLKSLSANVAHIDEVSRVISDSLQSHRSKLEEMLVVNKMLRKVHFLIELPERMKRFLEAKKLNMAVKFWVAGDHALTKHSGITTFQKTHEECSRIARAVYAELEKGVMDLSLSTAESATAARKMIEDMRQMRSTSIFRSTDPMAAEGGFYRAILDSLLVTSATDFNTRLTKLKSTFAEATNIAGVRSLQLLDQQLQTSALKELPQDLKLVFTSFASSCERCFDIVDQTDDDGDARLRRYVVSKACPQMADAVQWGTEVYSQFAARVVRLMLDTADASGDQLTKDTCLSILATVVRNFRSWMQAVRAVGNSIDPSQEVSSAESVAALDDACGLFLRALSLELEALADDTAVNDAQRYFLGALISRMVGKFSVAELATTAAIDATAWRSTFSDISRKFLHVYVMSLGQKIVAEQSGFVSRASQRETPSSVSTTMKKMLADINAAHQQHRDWFPTEAKHSRVTSGASAYSHNSGSEMQRSSKSGGPPQLLFHRREHQSLLSEVDRALSKASALLSTCPSSPEDVSITEALLVFVTKSLIETIRKTTNATNFTFQQIQLDATFAVSYIMRWCDKGYIRKEGLLVSLWSEVAACLFERVPSSTRSPLPQAVVDKLIAPAVLEVA